MKIKKVNITSYITKSDDEVSELLKVLIDSSIVNDDENFIAGGFARVFGHHFLGYRVFQTINDVHDYFIKKLFEKSKWSSEDTTVVRESDIDVFIKPSVELDDKYILRARALRKVFFVHQTMTRESELCKSKKLFISTLSTENFIDTKVQYIFFPRFRANSVEEIFERFDFVNSCYAITRSNGEYFLHYYQEAFDVDVLKFVKIQNITSPFLAKRLYKYINQKDCDLGLHQDSFKDLTEWCFAIRNGILNFGYLKHFTTSHLMSHLDKLIEIDILKNEQIVIFLKMWQTTIKKNPDADVDDKDYGLVIPIDWSVSKL